MYKINKLYLNLTDVSGVNVFVLWKLKYPKMQQKKNNRRHLYLLSLGDEMVTQYIRRRGNVGRHTHWAMRAMGVTCKHPAAPTAVKEGGGRQIFFSNFSTLCICPTAKGRKTDWKCCQCLEWVCKNHSIKTIQITCDICKEQSY